MNRSDKYYREMSHVPIIENESYLEKIRKYFSSPISPEPLPDVTLDVLNLDLPQSTQPQPQSLSATASIHSATASIPSATA